MFDVEDNRRRNRMVEHFPDNSLELEEGEIDPREITLQPRSTYHGTENVQDDAGHGMSPPRGRSNTRSGGVDDSQTSLRNRIDELRMQGSGRSRSTSGAGQKRHSDFDDERSSKFSRRSRANTRTRRSPGEFSPFKVSIENCKPGTIIQGVLYEKALDERLITAFINGATDTNIELLSDGYYVRKNRPWIVTAVYYDHYMCIPLHTHNGEGLATKQNHPGLLREFVKIRYNSDTTSTTPQPESNERVLTVQQLWDNFEIGDCSDAWLTYGVSRRFNSTAYVIGKLTHLSLITLMDMLQEFQPWSVPAEENMWEPPDPEDRSLGMGMRY